MATRTKRVKRVPKVYAAASTYIDPIDCDSTVSYKVISRSSGSMYGSVQLADCGRKIDWYFSDEAGSVVKIDKAIEALQEFRVAFVAAQKAHRTRRTKKTDEQ